MLVQAASSPDVAHPPHVRWLAVVARAAASCEVVSGVALVFIMLLTGADIVGRMLGRPIPGSYEIVSFTGGLVAGLALPATSLAHGHVFVDLLTSQLSPRAARAMSAATRIGGAAVLLTIAWGLVGVGADLRDSGEVSPVLAVPFWPIAYGIATAFVLASLATLAAFAAPEAQPHEGQAR